MQMIKIFAEAHDERYEIYLHQLLVYDAAINSQACLMV